VTTHAHLFLAGKNGHSRQWYVPAFYRAMVLGQGRVEMFVERQERIIGYCHAHLRRGLSDEADFTAERVQGTGNKSLEA
jgi:hypothetical protein